MSRVLRSAVLAGVVCAAVAAASSSGSGAASPLRYVALGDSFSSGEGVPPYRPATNRYLSPHDLCHRSYHAYPEIVAARRSSPGAWSFWACSGARLRDMASTNLQNPVEKAQLDRVAPPGRSDPGVGLVTLTIGGNDAQFSEVWMGCLVSHAVSPLFGSCQGGWRASLEAAIRRLRAALPGVLRTLRARAPRARILVLGYPDPFPAVLPPLSRCTLWFAPGDLRWIAKEAAALNAAIRAAAARAGVTYLPPSGFAGHDACSRAPWFNGLELDPTRFRGSFHPNAQGQRQLAKIVLARL